MSIRTKLPRTSSGRAARVQLRKIPGKLLRLKEERVPQHLPLPGLNRSIPQQLTLIKWPEIKERLKQRKLIDTLMSLVNLQLHRFQDLSSQVLDREAQKESLNFKINSTMARSYLTHTCRNRIWNALSLQLLKAWRIHKRGSRSTPSRAATISSFNLW